MSEQTLTRAAVVTGGGAAASAAPSARHWQNRA